MNEQSAVFAAELATVTTARHFVRDAMNSFGLPELSDDAQLGASELIANAVVHAGTEYTVTVRRGQDIVVEVHDGDARMHRLAAPIVDPNAERGRGLRIVAAISRDWGIVATAAGKCVWFALEIPEQSNGRLISLADAHPGSGRIDRAG